MDIYEKYGRAVDALEECMASHRKTVALLAAIKSGKVDIERLTVTDEGWSLSAKEDETAEAIAMCQP